MGYGLPLPQIQNNMRYEEINTACRYYSFAFCHL